MKWAKRTWLSIIRRPFKSILLLLVVFVMGNLLAGSLAIITTSKTVKEELKKNTSPEATIGINELVDYTETDPKNTLYKYDDVVKTLGKNDRVISSEYHYTTWGYVALSDLGFENDIKLDFNFYGTNIVESSPFASGKQQITTIVDNRNFNDTEVLSDEPVILVDYPLGEIQEGNKTVPTGMRKLGNEVTLTIPFNLGYNVAKGDYDIFEYKFKAKIIGVFNNTMSSDIYENRIYIPNDALLKVMENANQELHKIHPDENYYVPKIDFTAFKIKDLESLSTFDEEAKKMVSSLPEIFEYESSTATFARNSGPVETLDAVAQVIFISAIVATVVIVGLVIVFFISDRKQEMGIYSSLGERKKNVVMQMMCEVLLVSVIAITLAGGSGIFVGNKLSRYMLEVQRYVKREQDLGYLAKLPVIYKPIKDGLTMSTRDEVIDLYETKPTAEYFTILYSSATLTVLVSCVLPMMYLTHLKPKEILM